jgi:hypothetical protein
MTKAASNGVDRPVATSSVNAPITKNEPLN